MEPVREIPGVSGWELVVEKKDGEAAILSAFTGEEKAELPDEIDGMAVTAIRDRALVTDHISPAGEKIRITYGSQGKEQDNKKLEELALPRFLRSLGSYALMNCRNLKKITLYDKIEYIGVSPFMNCREMKEVHFRRTEGGTCEALYYILSSMPNEFDLTVMEEDGSLYRFIIPEYYELLEENEPTHFFNMTIEGRGYPYHAVFGRTGYNVNDYDELFPDYIKGYHERGTAMRMAYYRLRFPAGLSETAEKSYTEFLLQIAEDSLKFAVEQRDIQGLQILLSAKPGIEELKAALDHARDCGYTEAVALLLEATHAGRQRAGNRRYDF